MQDVEHHGSESNSELARRGAVGEEALNRWLQTQALPYVSICHHPDTFSKLFPGHVKRPDFFLLLQSVGTIAIDAKNYAASGGVLTLGFEEELRRSVLFERLFRLPVWYAYLDQASNGEAWRFISALKAVEVGRVRRNSKDGKEFLAIPLEEFAYVQTAADLALLYSQTLPGMQRIAASSIPA